MASYVIDGVHQLLKRQAEDADPDEGDPKAGEKEISSAFALFILIMLLIIALFTSYLLQSRKVQAVHETVLSIFAGMVIGLTLRLTSSTFVQSVVSFDYQFFFNLLLPPIILASGYELHQANFFRNMGSILTFAFAGTFISAIVLGLILWLWTRIPLDGFSISFLEAFSVGATLSATDPVTILAIFNVYKVDPKLYTVIFGESILNDAIAIVLFETAQSYIKTPSADGDVAVGSFGILSLFEAIGTFLLVFFGSLVIGVAVGILTTLGLKWTRVRRFPKIESCLILLIAYASYFFATGISMSGKSLSKATVFLPRALIFAEGIVALLFCGITMKHYAYYNMSRRTQLATKFTFQLLSQLSENFIFIYLGLTLFTEKKLIFKPLFIIITVFGICVARYLAVFPLSKLINWTIRFRAKRRGKDVSDELPHSYQVMLFWAGLRGAVGVALASGLKGSPENVKALQATVLVVVVLTIIIFGGTTARMLEIMGIRTGVVEEVDSDDEFDIENVTNGTYYKRSGAALGHNPRLHEFGASVPLSSVNGQAVVNVNGNGKPNGSTIEPPINGWEGSYSSGSRNASPPTRPKSTNTGRKNSSLSQRDRDATAVGSLLLSRPTTNSDDDVGSDDSDLPPAAPRRSPKRRVSPSPPRTGASTSTSAAPEQAGVHRSATGVIRDLFSGSSDDHAAWFTQLDEGFIKPHLLLDQNTRNGGGGNV
ncbi:monovalent cation:H+ antiporter, CPA1 (nhx1) [Agyrium rufum]|nr:monovalent cation:H+ antiporter, CPA1 (nhx1) [Agyrium rufum]